MSHLLEHRVTEFGMVVLIHVAKVLYVLMTVSNVIVFALQQGC